jgi:hypothetical protein
MRTYSGEPKMGVNVASELRKIFAESDAELARWLGRDLPWPRP